MPLTRDKIGNTLDDWRLAVALGKVPGVRTMSLRGVNNFVSVSANDWGDLTSFGEISQQPATPMQLEILANEAVDRIGTSGAHEVRVEGLDANGDELIEDVPLTAGPDPIVTTGTFSWVNILTVTKAGSVGRNASNIYAHPQGDTTKEFRPILGNYSVAADADYKVPNGKQLIVTGMNVAMQDTQDSEEMNIAVMYDLNGAWVPIINFMLSARDAVHTGDLPIYGAVNAGTNIRIRVRPSVGTGTGITGYLYGYLVDDDVIGNF